VDYGSLHSDFGEVSVQEESTSFYHISCRGSGKTVQSHLKLRAMFWTYDQMADEDPFHVTFLKFERNESRLFLNIKNAYADPSGCTVSGVSVRPLTCWDCGFESHWGMDVCLL